MLDEIHLTIQKQQYIFTGVYEMGFMSLTIYQGIWLGLILNKGIFCVSSWIISFILKVGKNLCSFSILKFKIAA